MNNCLRSRLVMYNTMMLALAFFGLAVGSSQTIPRVIYHNTGTGMVFSFLEVQSEAHILSHATPAILLFLSMMAFVSIVLAEQTVNPVRLRWRKQQAFVADASHELRTPLSTIRSNLDVVRDDPSQTVESLSKWLDNIDQEVQRMTILVSDLMLLARTDSDQELIERRNFRVASAIESAVETFEPAFKNKGITFSGVFDYSVSYYGDEARIKQLVVILVDNALKYTPEGGAITVTVNSFDQAVTISVADTGIGIPEQHLPHIFDRFYRVDHPRKTGTNASGLGLAIAAWIVRGHCGTVQVDSQPGKGTAFHVRLPQ